MLGAAAALYAKYAFHPSKQPSYLPWQAPARKNRFYLGRKLKKGHGNQDRVRKMFMRFWFSYPNQENQLEK